MFRARIKQEITRIMPADVMFSVSIPEQSELGDYSSNVALVLAKHTKRNPKEVAEDLLAKLISPPQASQAGGQPQLAQWIERVEVAGPGFLNFHIKHDALYAALARCIVQKKPIFAKATTGEAKKICLEFVSANPTGPLTMANGRGGFYGDVLANVLEAAGHNVAREYYINDAGNQIRLLGESISAAEGKIQKREEHYRGTYIEVLKGKTPKQAILYLLKNIKASLKRAGIHFDVWFSEDANLHKLGKLQKTLQFLQKKNAVERREGATWLGEAVLIKSDGAPTYFLGDLAYHYDKFLARKFDVAINIWGADHHGYVARMKRGVEALGVGPDQLHIIIMQLVRLVSGGKEARMSKRAGDFVTLDDLLDMVGVDAARWFFLERSPDTHMDFNLDLAEERSKKNPVYYVQYAHARACSILRKDNRKSDFPRKSDFLKLLVSREELALIKKILQLPEVVEDVANDYQVQRLPKYAHELAQAFTDFYEHCRVINAENQELTKARLYLVKMAQKTLADTLSLMGIKAPQKM